MLCSSISRLASTSSGSRALSFAAGADIFSAHRTRLSLPFSSSGGGPPPTLGKSSLAALIAEEHDLSLAKSKRIVDTVLDAVVETVSRGGKARLSGFASLKRAHSAARKGRNPKTGEIIEVEARERVEFRAHKAFKDAVNGR